jgi:hypothetical protein
MSNFISAKKAVLVAIASVCTAVSKDTVFGPLNDDGTERDASKGSHNGKLELAREPSAEELETLVMKLTGADKRKKIRQTLLGAVADMQSKSCIVKIGKREMSGAEWFAALNEERKNAVPPKKELTIAKDWAKEFAALAAKNDGKAIIKRGIEFTMPKCLKTGKKGRTAVSSMTYLSDLI